MRRAACAAAVIALAGWCASGASAALPLVTDGVPYLVPGRVLRPSPELQPRTALAASRATSLSTIPLLEKRATRLAWNRAFASAKSYVRGRLGRVSFALVDDTGRVRVYHGHRDYYSASLVKAMLLVAYLRRHAVRHHSLSSSAQATLDPMIRRSDNDAATRMFAIVGEDGLWRLARRAGMRWFGTSPSWGDTALAAEDQAAFFYGIDQLVPSLHRAYAKLLLSHIIPEQRWGIPEAVHDRGVHARVFFKGGWRPSTGGWIVNQSALLMGAQGRRVSVSVLTDHDPDFTYGTDTVRGVARRLVRPLRAPAQE